MFAGLVAAAALTGGTLLAAGPASATPVAQAKLAADTAVSTRQGDAQADCLGHGCIGLDPVAAGCDFNVSSPETVTPTDWYRTGETTWKSQTVTVQLRYSPGCRSVWARVQSTAVPTFMDFWVYNRDTGAKESRVFNGQGQWTLMVGDDTTQSQACADVSRGPNFPPTAVCTGFF
jgi:hypothetical protein